MSTRHESVEMQDQIPEHFPMTDKFHSNQISAAGRGTHGNE